MPTLTTRADLTLRLRAHLSRPDEPAKRVSVSLTDDVIGATVGRFVNRVSAAAVPSSRRATHRSRLDVLAWMERGALNRRPHVHALLERPASWSAEDFAALLSESWRRQPFGYDEVRVAEVESLRRSMGYNAKAGRMLGNVVYFSHEPDESAWWRRP